MVVRDDPVTSKLIDWIFVALKAYVPISVKDDGKTRLDMSAVQPLNALLPMDIKLTPMVNETIEPQSWNALIPTTDVLFPKFTENNDEHFANADWPILKVVDVDPSENTAESMGV